MVELTDAMLVAGVRAATDLFWEDVPHEDVRAIYTAMQAARPSLSDEDVERDGCEFCRGTKGGVSGNENIIGGKVVCDYCTVLLQEAIAALHISTDSGVG